MYPVEVLVAVIVDVELKVIVVVFEGATAGRPFTGLTSRRVLDGVVAGMGLKRMLGMIVVERDVDDEAVSTMVLMIVFGTVVYAVDGFGVTVVMVVMTLGMTLVAREVEEALSTMVLMLVL